MISLDRFVIFLSRLPELVFFENNVFLVLKVNSQGVDSFGECVFIFCGLRVWQGVKYFVRISNALCRAASVMFIATIRFLNLVMYFFQRGPFAPGSSLMSNGGK